MIKLTPEQRDLLVKASKAPREDRIEMIDVAVKHLMRINPGAFTQEAHEKPTRKMP